MGTRMLSLSDPHALCLRTSRVLRAPPSSKREKGLITYIFFGVVRFSRPGLDGDRRVAFLIELRPVGHGPDHIARTQSERCSQRRQRCDQYGNDGFDDLLFGHNGCDFCLTMDNINDETGHVSPCIA